MFKDNNAIDLVKESFDLEDEMRLEQSRIKTNPNPDRLALHRLKNLDVMLSDITENRVKMFENNHGLLEAYNAKYGKPSEAAPAQEEGPGILSRILKGAGDTAKFAIRHPLEAGKNVGLGVDQFRTMPFRALESVLGTNQDSFSPAKNYMKDREAGVAESTEAAGVDPRGTGPVVLQALGAMALPVGPTLKAGQILKNALKVGGFSGGAYAGERVAADEPVDDEGLVTSTGIGTGLGALLSLLTRGKAKPGAAEHTPPPDAGAPPPQLEHKPPMVTPEPPRQLPAPDPPSAPGHHQTMVKSITAKHETGAPLSDEEKRFLLWFKQNQGTPPPNVSGERTEVRPLERVLDRRKAPIDVTPTPATASPKAGLPAEVPPAPSPLAKILKTEPPASVAPLSEAAKAIEAEKAGRLAAGRTVDNVPMAAPKAPVAKLPAKPGEAIAPKEILDTVRQMDEATEQAAKEALLGEIVSGKKNVKDIPVKRKEKRPPKSETPAPAVKGEAGAMGEVLESKPLGEAPGNIATSKADVLAKKLAAEGKDPRKAVEMAEFKADQRVSSEAKAALVKPDESIRLEDFIKREGYTLTEKEPFPGEKSYDVRDAKGTIIARGDRENIVHGLNARNEGKGIKLHSFPSGLDDFADLLKARLMGQAGRLPKDTTVSNSPHREKIVNMALRKIGLTTPQFAMRHSKGGTTVVNAALDAEDFIKTRVNDLMYDPKRLDAKGEYQPTDLFHYFSMDAAHRQKVNDVLVLGDKVGKTYTDAELVKAGLTIEQIQAYRGVREALGKVVNWVKELGTEAGEFDARKLDGYIPRVWKGNWEIFEGGVKHVPTKGDKEVGSSFGTLTAAAEEAHRIKALRPDAKLDIRFFADPDYLPGRGILDARAVARVKKNLESMGKLDEKAIDEAFKMGRSVSGFAKHLLQRKDAAGYETEDLDKVLFSYFNQAARKVEFKKVREVVEGVIKDHKKDLTGPQVEYLQAYVERVAGKPSWDKMAFEQFIKHTPIGQWIDPISNGQTLRTLNDWVTYKSLGFGNVSWALINLDTLSRHVWPMLQAEAKGMGSAFASEKYMFEGVKSFYKDKALRQKLAHNGVIDIQMMSESRPQIGHQFGEGKWTPQRMIMLLGLATEEFARGVAAISRYKMALDQGFDDKMAMRLASRFVAETAARYSKAGKQPIFTGPTGETLGKFKPYLGVMVQNMYKAMESKDMGVITRYILASLGVGGIIGAVPGAENVDHLATKLTGMSPIQWAYDNLPEGIVTGALSTMPGQVGIPNMDLSRKAGLPDIFPSDLKGWAGPVLNTYGQAMLDAMSGEYGEALKDLIPTSIRNVLAVTQKPGYVVGRFDKPSVELPPGIGHQIARGLGFQSPEEVRSSRDYSYLHTLDERRESALQRLTRRIYQNKASDAEREEFARLGGTSRRLREEGRRENSTSRQRQERHLPKILRHQIHD